MYVPWGENRQQRLQTYTAKKKKDRENDNFSKLIEKQNEQMKKWNTRLTNLTDQQNLPKNRYRIGLINANTIDKETTKIEIKTINAGMLCKDV